MNTECPEYWRLLKEYERAFHGWAESTGDNINTPLSVLEEKYQPLADHLQSCPACLTRLGYADAAGPKAPNQ